MNMKNSLLRLNCLLAIAGAICSCSVDMDARDKGASYTHVSVQELLQHKDRLNGSMVQVEGYSSMRFTLVLFASKAEMDGKSIPAFLTVAGAIDPFSFEACAGRNVRVLGKFEVQYTDSPVIMAQRIESIDGVEGTCWTSGQ